MHPEIQRADVRGQGQKLGGDDRTAAHRQHAKDEPVAAIDDERVPDGDAHDPHRHRREGQIEHLVEQDEHPELRGSARTHGDKIPVELLVKGEEQARRGQCRNEPEERVAKIGRAGRRLVFEEPCEENAGQDARLAQPELSPDLLPPVPFDTAAERPARRASRIDPLTALRHEQEGTEGPRRLRYLPAGAGSMLRIPAILQPASDLTMRKDVHIRRGSAP